MVGTKRPANVTQTPDVRARSSMRKRRSDAVEHVARVPSQSRSLARFERILKAAEELLAHNNIEDISFYDIAKQARISPASINYLFPTMAALRIELSKRYAAIGTEVTVHSHHEQSAARNPSWQSWIYHMGWDTRADYNQKRYMCEVILGPQVNREARMAVIAETDRAGIELLARLREFFIIPEIPDLGRRFGIALDIAERIWARAYVLHGFIDDETFEESMRAQIAYLRTILPESLAVAPLPEVSPPSPGDAAPAH